MSRGAIVDRAELQAVISRLRRMLQRDAPGMFWDPSTWDQDAMTLALELRLQITPCSRCVRVDQAIEHFQDHKGDKKAAFRWAVIKAAMTQAERQG
jgi:hypothetical protein